MSTSRLDNDLTRFLHEGDPLAHDPGLAAADRGEMRRTVLSQVPEQSQSLWHQLSPALSVAVLLVVVLGIAWWPNSTHTPVTASGSQTEAIPSATESPLNPGSQRAGNSLDCRKIQFETPGGTLVVWVLNPNFPS